MSEPSYFGFREMPDDRGACPALFREMAELQAAGGATFFRYTIVSPEYASPPCPPYPQGLYVEGWDKQPSEQPSFDFPVTALAKNTDSPPPIGEMDRD